MESRPIPFLDLRAHLEPLADAISAELRAVLDRRDFILGAAVDRFERAAAEYVSVRHAVGVASGTDAIILGLAASGVGPGDEVVTTPFTFYATVTAILATGARPVLADIDPHTYNVDPQRVEDACTERTAALLPVHLFGQMAPMAELGAIAERRGCRLVEDAAQALGATIELSGERKAAGAVGRAGCFSFYPTKNLGGIGDGGMVTTDDDDVAARLRSLRVHGQGGGAYRFTSIGWNSRLDSLQAAALSVMLPHLDGWNRARRTVAASYDEMFAQSGLVESGRVRTPHAVEGSEHIYHQYVLRVAQRDALRDHLQQRQIGCNVYYPVPLHLQPSLEHLGWRPGEFPHSERAAEEVLALPVYPELAREDVEAVVAAVADFYRGAP